MHWEGLSCQAAPSSTTAARLQVTSLAHRPLLASMTGHVQPLHVSGGFAQTFADALSFIVAVCDAEL